jgi:chemotaxis protein CheZ
MAIPALMEDVEKQLHLLSKSAARVDPNDILEVVQSVMASVEGDRSSLSQFLKSDIEALADYISTTKAEITEVQADKISSQYLPEASSQLFAIVDATEKATNDIFEAVELIEELASTMESKQAEQIVEAVTRVYEACSFQDITGQRISKVVNALQDIEARVDALLQAFGGETDAAAVKGETAAEETAASEPGALPDANLMNGPQLSEAANSQDDIDALLASLK